MIEHTQAEVDALVAAAYEAAACEATRAAASYVEQHLAPPVHRDIVTFSTMPEAQSCVNVAVAIRALIPVDARKALDDLLAKARQDGRADHVEALRDDAYEAGRKAGMAEEREAQNNREFMRAYEQARKARSLVLGLAAAETEHGWTEDESDLLDELCELFGVTEVEIVEQRRQAKAATRIRGG